MLLAGGKLGSSLWDVMPAGLCPWLRSVPGWGQGAAGGQTPKGKEDSGEIQISDQAKGSISLEGPMSWIIAAEKAHNMLYMCCATGLQPYQISLLPSK